MSEYKLYHDIPFIDVDSHRKNTYERGDHIKNLLSEHLDVSKSVGLDIGCAEGGLSFCLSDVGAEMHAVDSDTRALNFGREINELGVLGGNVSFYEMTVPSLELEDLIDGIDFDFCIFMSVFMWVVKDYGMEAAESLMELISSNIPILIFETAQYAGDGVAGEYQPFRSSDDVHEFLNHFYKEVNNTGVPVQGWRTRDVFVGVN